MKRWLILPLLLIAGCGGTEPKPPVPIPPASIAIPPESARTPEGAKPQAPPVSLPQAVLGEKHISQRGLSLIEGFEGYSRCAYWDPYGRVWTAGYGQTRGIYGGFCFSNQGAAQQNLKSSVESEYEWALRSLGSLNQNQWDALCSFAYNLGAGIFTGSLRADIQSRHFFAASQIMLQYDHAGGVVLEGLRTRRQREVALFLTPIAEPARPKHSRAYLLATRAALRRDLTNHRCRVAPYHGRGRYHAICAHWLQLGNEVNAELRS